MHVCMYACVCAIYMFYVYITCMYIYTHLIINLRQFSKKYAVLMKSSAQAPYKSTSYSFMSILQMFFVHITTYM